ncbi:response regulator transcription factor [Deinococcus ruber]|uniref:DNA-binding response regulator n=1 Tax=Deinococcus ruber TaxID=1848197 RepID=A0A918CIQ9_9DEIO|nr:response regulator transcription factor [Deinococcus ruber]GGR27309.1 DNA-binding response regulator [Deinococcus ruber]
MVKVLVVDDDPAILEILTAYLERSGYDVTTSMNGLDAEHLLGKVDVAILDWMLPGQSGVDLTRHARASYPNLPLLLLTARGDEDDRVHGLKSGADDYVVKPFSPREVVARVEALLRRANVRDVITLGSLVIGAQARTVTLAGADLSLSRTEFELLLTLARHSGIAFSRERLLERVWGVEFAGTERVVDVNIQMLRRKLGDDPDAPTFIETVRGFGYRFKDEDL